MSNIPSWNNADIECSIDTPALPHPHPRQHLFEPVPRGDKQGRHKLRAEEGSKRTKAETSIQTTSDKAVKNCEPGRNISKSSQRTAKPQFSNSIFKFKLKTDKKKECSEESQTCQSHEEIVRIPQEREEKNYSLFTHSPRNPNKISNYEETLELQLRDNPIIEEMHSKPDHMNSKTTNSSLVNTLKSPLMKDNILENLTASNSLTDTLDNYSGNPLKTINKRTKSIDAGCFSKSDLPISSISEQSLKKSKPLKTTHEQTVIEKPSNFPVPANPPSPPPDCSVRQNTDIQELPKMKTERVKTHEKMLEIREMMLKEKETQLKLILEVPEKKDDFSELTPKTTVPKPTQFPEFFSDDRPVNRKQWTTPDKLELDSIGNEELQVKPPLPEVHPKPPVSRLEEARRQIKEMKSQRRNQPETETLNFYTSYNIVTGKTPPIANNALKTHTDRVFNMHSQIHSDFLDEEKNHN